MAAQQAIALIGLAIILLVGFSAIDAGVVATGNTTNIDNETWTPDAGNWTELENSNIDGAVYYDNETVRNSSGAVMTDGTDYEWNRSTGELKAVENESLDGESSANITYSYSTYTEEQQGGQTLLFSMLEWSSALLIVLAVVVILAGVKVVTGGL